jgi:hypothetical protein
LVTQDSERSPSSVTCVAVLPSPTLTMTTICLGYTHKQPLKRQTMLAVNGICPPSSPWSQSTCKTRLEMYSPNFWQNRTVKSTDYIFMQHYYGTPSLLGHKLLASLHRQSLGTAEDPPILGNGRGPTNPWEWRRTCQSLGTAEDPPILGIGGGPANPWEQQRTRQSLG